MCLTTVKKKKGWIQGDETNTSVIFEKVHTLFIKYQYIK